MQHAQPVRVVHRLGDGAQQDRGVARRRYACRIQALQQAATVHQLHRVVDQPAVLAHLVHDYDIGMLQQCCVLRLVAESCDEFLRGPLPRRQKLDRNVAVEAALARAIDQAHPALADQFQQFVVAELALRGIIQVRLCDPRSQQRR